MATLTRSEMLVALDLELEILNSKQMSRLDAPVADYFLNQAVEAIINEVVKGVAQPNEDKRAPNNAVGMDDILNKYNTIHTLIKDEPLVISGSPGTTFNKYTLPVTTIYRFEGSHSNVTPIGCTISIDLPTVIPDITDVAAFNDNPFGGGKKAMVATVINSELYVYHLGRYTINSVNAIYIALPAKISASANCNLPAAIHMDVVKRAAKLIAASVSSENYENLVNEIRSKKS